MAASRIEFLGKSFLFNDLGGKDLVATTMKTNEFEAPLPSVLITAVEAINGIFLDVGANTGLYSVLAGLARSNSEVVAFEPHGPAFDACRANLEANGLTPQATMHKIALSDQAGDLPLYLPKQEHGLMESSASLESNFHFGGSMPDETVPIDMLDNFKFDSRIGVMKVDIEGHEHKFLAGAEQTINRDRPLIFAEVLPVGHDGDLDKFVREHGYLDYKLRRLGAVPDYTVRFDADAWNHAFVPIEGVALFENICGKIGLPILKH